MQFAAPLRRMVGLRAKERIITALLVKARVFIAQSLLVSRNPLAVLKVGTQMVYLRRDQDLVIGKKEKPWKNTEADIRIKSEDILPKHASIIYDPESESKYSLQLLSPDVEIGLLSRDESFKKIAGSQIGLEKGVPLKDGDIIVIYLSGLGSQGVRETMEIQFNVLTTEHPVAGSPMQAVLRAEGEAGIVLSPALAKSEFALIDPGLRDLAYRLKHGNRITTRWRIVRRLLRLNTPASWTILLSDVKFFLQLMRLKKDALIRRVCELAEGGHREAQDFIGNVVMICDREEVISRLNSPMFEKLIAVLSLPFLRRFVRERIYEMGKNSVSDIVYARLLELAKTDEEAKEFLKELLWEGDKKFLDCLVDLDRFGGFIDILSTQELSDFAIEKNLLYYRGNTLRSAADIVNLRFYALAQQEDEKARSFLVTKVVMEVSKDYLEHLAAMKVFEKFVNLFSAEELCTFVSGRRTKLSSYNSDNLEGTADIVYLRLLKLAKEGNGATRRGLRELMLTWSLDYREHLTQFELLEKFNRAVAPR